MPLPVPYANLTNPQTLNLYAIVNDNPESFVDLNGHDPGVCNSGGAAGDRNCPTPPQSSPSVENKPNPANPPQPQTNASNQSNLNTPTQSPDEVQQQTYAAMAQKQAEAKAQQSAQSSAPAVGSPEYIAQLSGKVNAEMHAGNQLILGFAVAEGVGLGTIAVTAAAPVVVDATVAARGFVLTHPEAAVDLVKGFTTPMTGVPPASPVGFTAYIVGRLSNMLIP